jgi:hypothetical protein
MAVTSRARRGLPFGRLDSAKRESAEHGAACPSGGRELIMRRSVAEPAELLARETDVEHGLSRRPFGDWRAHREAPDCGRHVHHSPAVSPPSL